MRKPTMVLLVCAVFIAGCQAPQAKAVPGAAVGSALGATAGAIVGHQYQETNIGTSVGADLGSVAGQIAESALYAQNKTQPQPRATGPAATKFCPMGGEEYPESFKYCPTHGIELRSKSAR